MTVNHASMLRRRVLATAAASRRALAFTVTPTVLGSARPAHGQRGPILIVGDMPAVVGDALEGVAGIDIADADPGRLEATAARFRDDHGIEVRRFRAEPHDLRLDLEALSAHWNASPPPTLSAARALLTSVARSAAQRPVVEDERYVVVYCSGLELCADDEQRLSAVREVYRVLQRGGVARFTVRLADEGTHRETLLCESEFSRALLRTGFYGIRLVARSEWPAAVRDGAEFRDHVLEAYRGKDGPCLDCGQAVIYRGPWRKVVDDDGHVLERDVRTAVCEKTYRILTAAPYARDTIGVEPYVAVDAAHAPPFSCGPAARSPRAAKRAGIGTARGDGDACC